MSGHPPCSAWGVYARDDRVKVSVLPGAGGGGVPGIGAAAVLVGSSGPMVCPLPP